MWSNKKPVLLLDRNYYPHRIISWKRAMGLLYGDKVKVEVLSAYRGGGNFDVSVLRLLYRSIPPAASNRRTNFSKRHLLIRDRYTCGYCGCTEKHKLTVDHVIPKSKGGKSTYANCITACTDCNTWKGSRTLEEAGMRLLYVPTNPIIGPISEQDIRNAPDDWLPFLQSWSTNE